MQEPSCGGAGTGVAQSEGVARGKTAWTAGMARFARDARGSTAIEYALIGSLIFLAAAGSMRIYANRMGGIYNQINAAVGQTN
ncbi:hypothetical protein MKK84_08975 [Methylobacterium sp. E-065]|uniref:Flp family type IVb pilin n=2 Tax=Methylobacterium TaxID=407 RepID=UPI001FBA77D3|nr:hypothetical protein [Methylobacterium sp. E-065]MCJ2017549.1 hypothetical protein [Methylobacterium sp. E-065]